MWHPRVLWRMLSISALCAVMYPFLLISSLVVRVVARLRGRRPGIGRWRGRVFHRWCRGIRLLLGMRIETHGRPPRPPFLLVTNHLGYIDILLLASQLPCVFVAKAEVAGWPLLGPLCSSNSRIVMVVLALVLDVASMSSPAILQRPGVAQPCW